MGAMVVNGAGGLGRLSAWPPALRRARYPRPTGWPTIPARHPCPAATLSSPEQANPAAQLSLATPDPRFLGRLWAAPQPRFQRSAGWSPKGNFSAIFGDFRAATWPLMFILIFVIISIFL